MCARVCARGWLCRGGGLCARGGCGRILARGRVRMRGEGVDLSDTSSEGRNTHTQKKQPSLSPFAVIDRSFDWRSVVFKEKTT